MSKKTSLILVIAFCLPWMNGWALEQKDGTCQIGSAEDLNAFAEQVNNGQTALNAVLIADVVCPAGHAMIGTSDHRYEGVFDGQGHTITVSIAGDEESLALFRYVNHKGVVKNLVVDGTVATSQKYAGGIVANHYGLLANCVSKVSITSTVDGDGTHGGLAALGFMGGEVVNCLSLAKIEGAATTNCGGIIGWMDGRAVVENNLTIAELDLLTVEGSQHVARNPGNIRGGFNNLYLADGWEDNDAKAVTEEQLKSGAVCFMLNSDQTKIQWTQTLGEDEYPMPFKTGKQVFASQAANCQGVAPAGTTFNNESGAECAKHDILSGHCQNEGCGFWDPFFCEMDAEGFWLLKSAEDMDWFAELHNYGGEYSSARLMADVDYSDRPRFLNRSNWYSGEFDGMGHTVTIDFVDSGETNNALFPIVAGTHISNLTVKGTINTGNKFAAGLVGSTKGEASTPSTFDHIITDVDIYSTVSGDGTHGGLVGVTDGVITATNCLALGDIVGAETNCCGGLIGWCSQATNLTNCAFAVELRIGELGSNTIGRYPDNLNLVNVAYVNPFADIPAKARQLSPEAVTNGDLAWALNGERFWDVTWYQTLEEDEHPVFDPTHGIVYRFGEVGGCVIGDQVGQMRKDLIEQELAYIQNPELVAQVSLKENYEAAVNAIGSINTMAEMQKVYVALMGEKQVVQTSADVYKKYIDKVAELLAYVENYPGFKDEDFDMLSTYFESSEEPSEAFPNGTAAYIIENALLGNEEIEAEIHFADDLVNAAIANGCAPGSEVTRFLTNPDLTDGCNGWEGVVGTAKTFTLSDGKVYGAGESWSANPMDMHQSVWLPKQGYYLFMMNGAYRPANDYSTYSHGAKIYANGNGVFLPTVLECIQPAEGAEDGVTCNITGEVADQPIYEDPADASSTLLGYAMHGHLSIAVGIRAGRAINSIIAEVGDDNMLTVGVCNPHGYYTAEEWTGFGNARLIYLGEDLENEVAKAALAQTLQGMMDRANTILNLYTFKSGDSYALYPNCDKALMDELRSLVEKAASETVPAGQYELIKQISALFDSIYDCRMAYSELYTKALRVEEVVNRYDAMLDESVKKELLNEVVAAYEAYENGSFTAEEARAALLDIKAPGLSKESPLVITTPEALQALHDLFVPAQMNYVALGADIDMSGVNDWKPLSENNTEGGYPIVDFDGRNHVIRNLRADMADMWYNGLFGVLCGNVRNLGVENAYVVSNASGDGILGGYLNHSTYNKPCYIENVWVTGKLIVNSGYCGGMFGNVAAESHFNNCYVNVDIETTASLAGGIIGRVRGMVDMKNVYAAGSMNQGGGIIGGGQQATTPPCTYQNVAVWNNTDRNFGTTAEADQLSGISYYDGSNFAELQKTVVAWDSNIWYCDMAEGSYPVLKDFATGLQNVKSAPKDGSKLVYDLMGRRIVGDKLQKGLYIIDGQKVMVK